MARKNQPPAKALVSVTVRMLPELVAAIRARAKRGKVSQNALIVRILADHFEWLEDQKD